MSGGLLFLPRLPLLFALFFMYPIIQRDLIFRYALLPAVLFVTFVLLLELGRPEATDVSQAFIRGANFLAALMIASVYYKAGSIAFKSDLYSILKWLPAQSIATTVLATAFPFLFVQIPGTEVYTLLMVLFHHTIDTSLSFGLVRPNGFFWEPGVFQIYLNLLLYFVLFERRDLKMSVAALVAVFCTQSTTGIFIAIALVMIYAFLSLRNGKLLRSIFFGALLIPLAIYAGLNFANKFEGEARGSFFARQYDTLTGLAIAAEYPLLGVGFDVNSYMREAAYLGFTNLDIDVAAFDDRRGNSNGLVQPLYSLGLILGGFFLVCMLRQNFFENRLLIGFILTASMASEPLLFTPFFLMLIFSGMTKRSMPVHNLALRARLPSHLRQKRSVRPF